MISCIMEILRYHTLCDQLIPSKGSIKKAFKTSCMEIIIFLPHLHMHGSTIPMQWFKATTNAWPLPQVQVYNVFHIFLMRVKSSY
jgi:hypothetical protein